MKKLLLGPLCKLQLQEAKYFSDGKIKGIQMIFLLLLLGISCMRETARKIFSLLRHSTTYEQGR